MIRYQAAHDDSDLQGILTLQRANLPENISEDEYTSQGFVTLKHDLDSLKKMNTQSPHIIAKDGDLIVGYTLVTTVEIAETIPLLKGTLNHLHPLTYQGNPFSTYKYFLMGQVCVAKDYRGAEVFASLYAHLAKIMKSDFDFIITEIAVHNTRSMHAHHKVGFTTIHTHIENGISWAIVLFDLR